MKITDVKPYPVWVGSRNQCLTKVETDEGIYGWGESGLSSRELAAAVANFFSLAIRTSPTEKLGFFDETIFPVQLKLDGAHFPVPTGPGLGVEVNEEYLNREQFKFSESPHLHKRDGSYTNW